MRTSKSKYVLGILYELSIVSNGRQNPSFFSDAYAIHLIFFRCSYLKFSLPLASNDTLEYSNYSSSNILQAEKEAKAYELQKTRFEAKIQAKINKDMFCCYLPRVLRILRGPQGPIRTMGAS